ncbi:MAG: Lrp/AsnC family transcriptional regulator [Pseudomonadota bacterium]
MNETDKRLIAYLRQDGRATIAKIASDLGLARNTVRKRLADLETDGDIAGYTVLTRGDLATHPVRGLMMLEIAGRGTEKVARMLRKMPEVQAVHSTNGAWDLIAEIGTDTLEDFDRILTDIRRQEPITRSETSLLLSTRR